MESYMQRTILTVAAVAFLQTAAAAQTCEGRPLFAAGGTQVGAGVEFADGANSFGGGIGMGASTGVYGRAVIGTTSYDNLGSSFNVGGAIGYQVPMGRTRALQLCPVGSFNFELGPNDIEDTGFDVSGRSAQFGIMLGTALPSGATVAILPNGGLSFAYAKAKIEDSDGEAVLEGSESYGILNLGLGFVFNSRVGLTPTVAIPLGLEGSEATFGLSVALNFGTPR
jgi:hypothetical protein